MTESATAGSYLGDWGRHTWTTRGADLDDLVPQLRYNKAAVAYETPVGVRVETIADATTDPYAGTSREAVWPPGGPFVLSDGQFDSAVAEAAAALVEYWSQPGVSGQVEIARVWAPDGEARPWDIDAGDLLDLPELETLGADIPPQRVIEVSKHVNGTATVSVGEATSLEALLGDFGPQAAPTRIRGTPEEA